MPLSISTPITVKDGPVEMLSKMRGQTFSASGSDGCKTALLSEYQ